MSSAVSVVARLTGDVCSASELLPSRLCCTEDTQLTSAKDSCCTAVARNVLQHSRYQISLDARQAMLCFGDTNLHLSKHRGMDPGVSHPTPIATKMPHHFATSVFMVLNCRHSTA